jgi:hypothetical protein
LRDRPIPLPFAVVFLSVVLNEGQPVGWYAKELNMTRLAMFKYIRSIGHRAENNAAGLGLVTINRKRGYRVKTAVVLTNKGRAVAAEVFRRLRGSVKTGAPPPTIHDPMPATSSFATTK